MHPDEAIAVVHHDSVGSTNRLAREAVRVGSVGPGRLIVAAEQTAGEGRAGRRWESPRGGLWCTLVCPLEGEVDRVLDGLGLRIGVACRAAVEDELSRHGVVHEVTLRWPNDVLVDGRKVGGCLVEVVVERGVAYVMAGVGINANNPSSELPAGLRTEAVALCDLIPGRANLSRLAEEIRRRVYRAVMHHGVDEATLADARSHLHGLHEAVHVRVDGEHVRSGRLAGLDGSGRLIVDTPEGAFTAPAGAQLEVAGGG